MRLKQEIAKRRISVEEFAHVAGVSHTWMRRILAGDNAGEDARTKIRSALEVCTVCGCKMTVPPDDVLFAVATRRRRTKT